MYRIEALVHFQVDSGEIAQDSIAEVMQNEISGLESANATVSSKLYTSHLNRHTSLAERHCTSGVAHLVSPVQNKSFLADVKAAVQDVKHGLDALRGQVNTHAQCRNSPPIFILSRIALAQISMDLRNHCIPKLSCSIAHNVASCTTISTTVCEDPPLDYSMCASQPYIPQNLLPSTTLSIPGILSSPSSTLSTKCTSYFNLLQHISTL